MSDSHQIISLMTPQDPNFGVTLKAWLGFNSSARAPRLALIAATPCCPRPRKSTRERIDAHDSLSSYPRPAFDPSRDRLPGRLAGLDSSVPRILRILLQ